jgi:hypothetical protein
MVFASFPRRGRTYTIRRHTGDNQCGHFCILLLLVTFFVGVPVSVYFVEKSRSNMAEAFGEASNIMVGIDDEYKILPQDTSHVVHLTSSDPVVPSTTLRDPDFGISAPGAVKLSREVEYCQWIETSSSTTNDDGDTEVTYYYHKEWVSHHVPSLFFDQPAAHFNPPRDPYPAGSMTVDSADVGAYKLTRPLIEKMNFWSTIYPTRQTLQNDGFGVSQAANDPSNPFVWTGKEHFYSAYEESTSVKLARSAMMFLEGSLLDWQIGDFLSSCTAGDIRIRFRAVVADRGVSVLGQLLNDRGQLGIYETTKHFPLGLVHEGRHSASAMFRKELDSAWWQSLFVNLLWWPWWLGVIVFLDFPSAIPTWMLTSLYAAASAMFVHCLVWGVELASTPAFTFAGLAALAMFTTFGGDRVKIY